VALGVAWVGFALDQPGSFRLLFGAHVDNLARFGEVRAAGRRAKALVRAVVREFLEAASLREDPERLFRVFWAQVHGTAWLTLEREYGSSFGRGDALALAAVGLDRLLGGVAAAAR
jgi:hypothetical protein